MENIKIPFVACRKQAGSFLNVKSTFS